MKHNPFQSIYREDFEVVEQRLGNVTLYPHTDQLPKLHRALNLEFLGALPGHIARVDKRADGFHKIMLRRAALMYCSTLNDARADQLRLYGMPDADCVTRLTIAQQITESTPLGASTVSGFMARTVSFPKCGFPANALPLQNMFCNASPNASPTP